MGATISVRRAAAVAVAFTVAACGSAGAPPAQSSASPVTSPAIPGTVHPVSCAQPVVALDPGHNPVRIDSFDPRTGAAQIDYPNGAEDGDVFSVATQVASALRSSGYRVVFLKRSPLESVTYRQRVDRAEQARADIGISIHTSPGAHAVFVQRVGLHRQGPGADGATKRVTFADSATAARSQRYAAAIASARTRAEGTRVTMQDNDFGGRAPLWSGNIPMIALIATHTPWVYNEFGPNGTGGSIPMSSAALRDYASGIAAGVRAALPRHC